MGRRPSTPKRPPRRSGQTAKRSARRSGRVTRNRVKRGAASIVSSLSQRRPSVRTRQRQTRSSHDACRQVIGCLAPHVARHSTCPRRRREWVHRPECANDVEQRKGRRTLRRKTTSGINGADRVNCFASFIVCLVASARDGSHGRASLL